MNSAAFLLATAVLGVDYGWRRTDDGQLEYLIQIEPALVRSFEQGQEIVSELPPEMRGVRRFRISVGNQALPRDPIPAQAAANKADKANQAEPGRVIAEPARPIESAAAIEPPAERQVSRRTGERAASWLDESGKNAAPGVESPTARESMTESAHGAASPSDSAATPENQPEEKLPRGADESGVMPWLIAALVALSASLGGNLYQGWNLASARRRYYQLVDRLGLSRGGEDEVTIVQT